MRFAFKTLEEIEDYSSDEERTKVILKRLIGITGTAKTKTEGKVSTTNLPTVTVENAKNSTSILGHSLNVKVNSKGNVVSSSALKPGPKDPGTFSYYAENIIVGRLGDTQGTVIDGKAYIDEPPELGAAFFGNNITTESKPALTLTKNALFKIGH